MKQFIHDNFLLQSKAAIELYHDYAADMPVIDYHCHLNPALIADNHRFENITEMWLNGDHYKWRAMRTFGIDENRITGTASDWEKFEAWSSTVPYTLRNPLYHWTQLELKRYFNIDTLLTTDSAREIYERCNEMLKSDEFSTLSILSRMNVETVCTTDDPVDSLEHHKRFYKSTGKNGNVKMFPAWRPDRALAVDNTERFNDWTDRLSSVCGREITTYDEFTGALGDRHGFFHSMGCRVSDHGLERIYSDNFMEDELHIIFKKIRGGDALSVDEVSSFKSALLYYFCVLDHSSDWVQQFHLGVLRNNNSRMYALIGPDTGFDSIGDMEMGKPLAQMLDRLDKTGQLARTVIYNINPADNELLATMAGNFQEGPVSGKIQFGSGWWFLDQKDGMEAQMRVLSTMGLISRFIGMTTDSRSFMSFTRHEYFRRILCNLFGEDIQKGLLPDDRKWIGKIICDICYYNAANYFRFS